MITYIDTKTVGIPIGKEVETFSLDRVFDSTATQAEVFDFIGKPTIADVLDGYNGTIFAYGQTGSGKSYTMMGYDIFEEESRGIIPRAASQIFESVDEDDGEIEYTLKCSMVEIYKEKIRDLLDTDSKNLSIKECPRRGIYVHGLNEICITSEKDILDVLTLGETTRTVASTKLNQTSSRSHMIFMLEVLQKLPNDSEKRGILNLVDLAGSEKVNNSGVTGKELEEAKKINLSLSALGNVIHSLVLNNDHIPYRDSKLTRILQESLGGNYKTNLIVAFSPAAKSIEETLNTMKFAIRAKSIKNQVKVNIKNSPDNYIKLIEQLRNQLTTAHKEILMLKEDKSLSVRSIKSVSSSVSGSPLLAKRRTTIQTTSSNNSRLISMRKFPNDIKIITGLTNISAETELKHHIDSLLSESLVSVLDSQSERQSLDYGNTRFSDSREEFERIVNKLRKKNTNLEGENDALHEKIRHLEQKIISSKSKRLKLEQRSHEYYENYHRLAQLTNKESNENHLLKKQNDNLHNQLKRLTKSLDDLDSKFKHFIENNTKSEDLTAVEFQEKLEITETQFPVVSEVDHEEEIDLDQSDSYDLGLTSRSISVEPYSLISTSLYAKELSKALETNAELSKDISLYQLKNQVIQAGVINANITRCMHGLH